MSNIDIENLLDRPVYAFEFQFMIGDIQDYLDVSEGSIESLYQTELQSLLSRAETENLPIAYRKNLETAAEHRFKVSLPLRIRYAALLSLVTSVEWSVKLLAGNAATKIGGGRNRKNEAVHILEVLNERLKLGRDQEIKNFGALVKVRNCIAHSAGLEQDDRFKGQLRSEIQCLKGVCFAEWHFLGSHIAIEKGALNPYIEEMKQLIVGLHRVMDEQGLFKKDS